MLLFYIHLALSKNKICADGQIFDQLTGKCIYCPKKQGILSNGICGTCPRFEGINTTTGICNICAEDECIDPQSRRCLPTKYGNFIKDPNNKECTCKNTYGIGSDGFCVKCDEQKGMDEKSKCDYCNSNLGIDQVTGKCVKCPNGQGIDKQTGKCTECPEGAYIDSETSICTCPAKHGIDPESNKCIKCQNGMQINPITYRCEKCILKGYNSVTGVCESCKKYEGIDPETLQCKRINGEDNIGINKTTLMIQKCPPGSFVDDNFFCSCPQNEGFLENGECGPCISGFGYDSKTYQCVKCQDKQVTIDGKCKNCSDYDKVYNEKTHTCESCKKGECRDPIHNICIKTNTAVNIGSCSCVLGTYFNFDINECTSYTNKTNQCKFWDKELDFDYWNEIPEGYCRNKENEECIKLKPGLLKDPITGNCTQCDAGMGYDTQLQACVECDFDKCIDENGVCKNIKYNAYKDPITKKCKCLSGNCGFTESNYHNKIINNDGSNPKATNIADCLDGCIDPETDECRELYDNEIIIYMDRKCSRCPYGSIPNNNVCVCQNGRMFNNITGKCVMCHKGEGFDQRKRKCIVCPIGEGILANGECGTCPDGQCIDNDTKKCIDCSEGQGIIPGSNICGSCPENTTYDTNSKKCLCKKGFILTQSNICEECPLGKTPKDGYCQRCDDGFCLNSETKECEYYIDDSSKSINNETGVCIQCPADSSKTSSNHCKCNDDNKGLNSDYSKCQECAVNEVINEFGKCSECNFDECINSTTKKCIPMSDKLFKDADGQCLTECTSDYNSYLRICGLCPTGSTDCSCNKNEALIEDNNGFKCGSCPSFSVIDSTSNRCKKCEANQCTMNNLYCVDSGADYKISPNGNCTMGCDNGTYFQYDPLNDAFKCKACEANQCYDKHSYSCRNPHETEKIDPETSFCICPLGYYVNNDDVCVECPHGNCILDDGRCIAVGSTEFSVNYDYFTRKCIALREPCIKENQFTGSCGYCPEGTSDSSCECVKEGEFLYYPNTCQVCPLNLGVDGAKFCMECDPGYGIDTETRKCTEPTLQQGFERTYKFIVNCNENECIDEKTLECIPVPINQAINPRTGKCDTCLPPNVIDPETNKCICPTGQGYDPKYHSCQVCEFGIDPIHNNCTNCFESGLGVNHETKYCQKCNDDEGVDLVTKECTKCTNGQIKDFDTPFCKCPPRQGLNTETNQCGPCKDGEGIEVKSNKCMECPAGFVINPVTLECINCPYGQGYDINTKSCIKCPEKQGIDPITRICRPLNEEEGINRYDGTCQICPIGQYIDNITRKCTCSSDNGVPRFLNANGRCEKCNSPLNLNQDRTDCFLCENKHMISNGATGECVECPPSTPYYQYYCTTKDEKNFCISDDGWHLILYGEDIIRDEETSLCSCKPKFGIFIEETRFDKTMKCIECNDYEGTDPITRGCTRCDNNNGEGIDPQTRVCRKCGDGEAINPSNLMCTTSPTDSILENNFWKCKDGKGFDSTGENCINCPTESPYIDKFTGKCVACNEEGQVSKDTKTCSCDINYGVNDTYKCVKCEEGVEGVDSLDLHCRICDPDKNEIIDPITGFCKKCNDDETVNRTTGKCQKCPVGTVLDVTNTYICKCPFGKGYDDKSSQCINCQTLGMGIDNNTDKCIKCGDGFGIDAKTGYCISCRKGCINSVTGVCTALTVGMSHKTKMCTCTNGFGFDPKTGLCHFCPIDEGIDPVTKECRVCKEDEGIDLWTFECRKCEKGLGITKNHNRCDKCDKGEGIDPTTRKCGPCKEGYGIDFDTKECMQCFEGQYIEEETNICVCPNKKGIDYENKKCIDCPVGKGIDPKTLTCIDCPDGQGIDRVTGKCKLCEGGQTKQETTNLCTCEAGLGYNPEFKECEVCKKTNILNEETNLCEKCPVGEGVDPDTPNKCKKCDIANHEGVDPVTKMCTKCKDDQGIDKLNGECIYCPEGSRINVADYECQCGARQAIDDDSWMCVTCYPGEGINTTTKRCNKCKVGYGADSVTGECVQCGVGQGIDTKTGLCVKCPNGLGIDQETRKCVKCASGEGIDPETFGCVECPSGFGINEETGYCEKCQAGEVINSVTKKCEKCNIEGYGIDEINNECTKCRVSDCYNCTANYRVCIECKETYKLVDNKCVDTIAYVTPTEIPGLVDAEVTVNNEGTVEIAKNDEIKDKPCKIKIESTHSGKTIKIDDVGQTQTQIILDKDIREITIEQESNKPIDIVFVGSTSINTQPIKITITNPTLTNIKGSGKIDIKSQDNGEQVSLDSIVPSTNGRLIISSDSQINAKKLDIYGDSVVEFSNENVASIETVSVQQKAKTTLQNIEIKNKLIAGVQTKIKIDKNVEISDAEFELSVTGDIASNSAVITGNLKGKPNKVTIKDRNIDEVLEENKEFIIAESNDADFKCNDWAGAFDTKSNSKYNHAFCKKDSDLTRLIADHNNDNKGKGGLKPGVIAAIVIVVVVVVAAVAVLVWFFVFRKRNSADSQDENSLSGNDAAI